jgi:hypothetical protein
MRFASGSWSAPRASEDEASMTEYCGDYCTSEEISQEYAVGPQRLLAFAMRGNLPMRMEDGKPLYDRDIVAKLFRRRDAAEGQGMTLGGGFKLGDTLEVPSTTKSDLHRPVRTYSGFAPRMTREEPVAPLRKAEVA